MIDRARRDRRTHLLTFGPGRGKGAVVEFDVVRRALPRSCRSGYGSTMVRVPNSSAVISTLPGGKLYV